MNTSIITSQTNSLPCELIIKIIYYLDEKTISEFATTCKFVNTFNFSGLLLPYKIIYNIGTAYYIHKQNIIQSFKNTLSSMYQNYNVKYYIIDLIDVFNNLSRYNIKDRIKSKTNNIYSINGPNRHQCLRHPINRTTHQFRIDEKPTDRRYIYTKLHSILNINKFTYTYLRKHHFNILALIY